jgi:hypothetical protein
MIYEKKAKLAKWAFHIEMSDNILEEGAQLAIMSEMLKSFPESEDGGAWFRRFRNSMGNWVLSIYINDDKLYNALKLVMKSK